MNDLCKENDLDGSQGDLRALGHPQQPWQAQPWVVQQVPFIFIKMNIWNMFHDRFLQRKRSGWVPRWSKGSRTPSATSTSFTMGSTASTIYIHKNEHLKHVHELFSKRKLCWWVPKWSEGSRTPSATSTSSTMESTASTIYIHKNEHLKHVSWTIFAKKTIWMGPKVIWGL